jgi:hypothetical protein
MMNVVKQRVRMRILLVGLSGESGCEKREMKERKLLL